MTAHHVPAWRFWSLLVLRIVLGLVMLYAAVPKFFDWENFSFSEFSSTFPPPIDLSPFARIIYNYRVLPVELVNLAGMVVPSLEMLCAFCLLAGCWLWPATIILTILQSTFLAGMVQAMIRGLDIHCGCFVGVDTKVGFLTLGRDSLILIGFILILILLRTNRGSSEASPSSLPQPHSSPE